MEKEQRTKSRIVQRMTVLAAAVVLLTTLGGGIASASGGGQGGGGATFTKWVTDWPNMAGVVGGSAGGGSFSGVVLDYNPGPTTVITAIYRVHGSKHDFVALVHVEQTGLHARVVGVVTEGWGQGSPISGEYTQISCDHDGLTTDCFRGTLDVGIGRDR
jgi:hypothetical protein